MNTDITPDFYNIDVGTIGVINDLQTFKESCVQGEKFFAVDTFQLFVANTTAGVSNGTVTEFMPRFARNITSTLSGGTLSAPASWKFQNIMVTITSNTSVKFDTATWNAGEWCNIWIISNDGGNSTFKITYISDGSSYPVANGRSRFSQYYDSVSVNIDASSGTTTTRIIGTLNTV